MWEPNILGAQSVQYIVIISTVYIFAIHKLRVKPEFANIFTVKAFTLVQHDEACSISSADTHR